MCFKARVEVFGKINTLKKIGWNKSWIIQNLTDNSKYFFYMDWVKGGDIGQKNNMHYAFNSQSIERFLDIPSHPA